MRNPMSKSKKVISLRKKWGDFYIIKMTKKKVDKNVYEIGIEKRESEHWERTRGDIDKFNITTWFS